MNVPKYGTGPIAVNPRGRQLIFAVAIVVFIIIVLRAFLPHENHYEKIARGLTAALQSNNVDAVKSYQNSETATTINRGIVGRAADTLAPLGKLKNVKETTPKDAADRVHSFDVTFDKGAIREEMKLDPDSKIVHFRYEPATP